MMVPATQYERYTRQLALPGFGIPGQEKLARAKVLVVGAGGLGCPVIQYLAAAGVGTIGIADGDRVELSNLHRQVLFAMNDIGRSKAMVAAEKARESNPDSHCEPLSIHLTNKNAWSLIEGYDVIVDCTDNFTARYMLSDASWLLNKPLVFAAVFQYEGQVAVFNITAKGTPGITYRDLFPEPPPASSVPDCNVAGVLGVLPGMMGVIQATEVIKIITGIGEVLAGKIINYDIRTHSSMVIELTAHADAAMLMPADRESFEAMDYTVLCGSEDGQALGKNEFDDLRADRETVVVDVREPGEKPEAGFAHLRVPMSSFDSFPEVADCKNIVVFCQSGARSAKAVGILKQKYGNTKQIFHLKGGLTAYYL